MIMKAYFSFIFVSSIQFTINKCQMKKVNDLLWTFMSVESERIDIQIKLSCH